MHRPIPFHFYTSLSKSYHFTFMPRVLCRPSDPFGDVYRSISLDIAQSPLIAWQFHLTMEASFTLFPPLVGLLTMRFFLYPIIPGSVFLSSSPRQHLSRGEDRKRIFEERIIGWSLAIRWHPCAGFSSTGGRKTILVRDRYISMLDPTWICADQLSSAVWRYLHIWVSLQCITSLKFVRRDEIGTRSANLSIF